MLTEKLLRQLFLSTVVIATFLSAKAEVFFRENKGQVKDQNWNPRPDILYTYDEGALHVHLKKDGLHYQLQRVLSWKQEHEQGSKRKLVDSLGIYRIDVQWLNTNKNVQIEKGNELLGYENFYNVPDGVEPVLFVKRYEKIIYKNIYNGIDLYFYKGKHGGLEYDYMVQPGANYQNIQWRINGATLRVNAENTLILTTPYGEIAEGSLLVTQDDKKIDAQWMVYGNVVSIKITGNYDKTKPLRIDPPVRLWGTYYAGSTSGLVSCVEDNQGNVYVAGDASANNMATSGAHQTTLGQGGSDGLLAKFNSNGQRIWATYYGGQFSDGALACGVDASGNVYLIGGTQSNSAIATTGVYQSTLGGSTDVFIAKFNANGVRQWGTYYGGSNNDYPQHGFVDGAGNVYVCGYASYTSTAIASTGAHQQSYSGGLGSDCFLAKFNTSGQRVWGTYYGGSADDRPGGCAVDAAGNVYLCGSTASTSGIATTGAHQTTLNNQGDAFLVKFNSNGVRQWGTYYGGMQEDKGVSCGADGAGNVYLLGRTNSTSLIATLGTHQSNFAGNYDAFIVKFNSTGTRQWGTYYGGTGNEQPEYLYTNSAGDILIAGTTNSASLVATTGAHQTNLAGILDAHLTLFNTNGQRTWGTYYGGTLEDFGYSCAIGNSGFYYLCGLAVSSSGIATTGTYQATLSNNQAGFLAKFEACVPPAAPTASGTTICGGQTATLTATAPSGVTFNWYAAPTGGTALGTGATFTTPTLNATTTYYVESVATGCPPSARTAVTVTVTPAPAAPIANTLTPGVCKDSTATFQVTSAGTTFNWYATATSTTILGTGTTFTSPPLQNSTSYFVERVENGCPSPRTQVFVQVIVAPDPTPASTQICAGATATLNSNLTTGTVNWYDAPNATTPVYTGYSYTTPVLNANTTYYIQNFVNGCPSARVPVTVTVVTPPAAPTVSGATICAGQTATLNATAPAGVTFAWFTQANGGTAVFTGNPFTTPALNNNTTYYVQSQAGTCNSARTAVTVTVNPSPAAPIANTLTPGVCKDSTATFQVTSAGTTFNWYATATSTTILGTGTTFTSPPLQNSTSYFVERVENGCPSQRTQVFVQVIIAPDPTPASTQICAGATATLNSNLTTGTVNWYDAPNATTPVYTGYSYTTPVLNATTTYYVQNFVNGCPSARVPVTVTVVTPPAAPTVSDVTICSGQNATLTATAPANVNFAWFTQATGGNPIYTGATYTTPSLTSTTTYYVESQVGNCSSTNRTALTVTVNPLPVVNAAGNSPLCEGSTVALSVNATPNATYAWSGPNGFSSSQQNPTLPNATVAATGIYTVTVTANGCSASASVNVTVNPIPVVNVSYNSPLCEGSDLALHVNTTSEASYSWSGPAGFTSSQQNPVRNNIQVNEAGTYSVTVTANGCSNSGSVNVVVNIAANSNITATANPSTICEGQSATLTASGATTYAWSNNLGSGATQNVTPQNTTTYIVTATDAATGCTATASATVTVYPLPNVTINASQTTLCESGSVTLTAGGATTYQWSTGESTTSIAVSPTATTTYTVTGTDANGCSNVATQTINVLNFTGPQFSFGSSITLCYGSNAPVLPITSTNGITGVWQPAAISNTQSGTYTFTPDGGQCAADYVLNVTVQQITLTAAPDTTVELASYVDLVATVTGSASGSYQWSPTENMRCSNCSTAQILALSDQVYTVTYTDAQTACSASATVNIDVNYDPNTIYYIPNAFTPNGDGNNDVFEIYGLKIKVIDLQIFNRWGELVFSERSPSPKWDGTYKGVLQNPDVFVYHTCITFYNGRTVKNKGSVTLIR